MFLTRNNQVAEGATNVVPVKIGLDVFDFFELLKVSLPCEQDYLFNYLYLWLLVFCFVFKVWSWSEIILMENLTSYTSLHRRFVLDSLNPTACQGQTFPSPSVLEEIMILFYLE